MSARSKAHRHRDEVGEVLAVHSDRPNPLVAGIFVLVWAVFAGLTLINPGENALIIIGPIATFALIFGLILLYISGERLVVCERGLVIGSVAPGLRPYVVRYEQIVPGSVVPVTGARKYGRETGHSGFPQSTVRRSAWTGRGVHFVGPSPKEARRHNALLAPLQDPPPLSIDGRWVWFAGTSSTPHRGRFGRTCPAPRPVWPPGEARGARSWRYPGPIPPTASTSRRRPACGVGTRRSLGPRLGVGPRGNLGPRVGIGRRGNLGPRRSLSPRGGVGLRGSVGPRVGVR